MHLWVPAKPITGSEPLTVSRHRATGLLQLHDAADSALSGVSDTPYDHGRVRIGLRLFSEWDCAVSNTIRARTCNCPATVSAGGQ